MSRRRHGTGACLVLHRGCSWVSNHCLACLPDVCWCGARVVSCLDDSVTWSPHVCWRRARTKLLSCAERLSECQLHDSCKSATCSLLTIKELLLFLQVNAITVNTPRKAYSLLPLAQEIFTIKSPRVEVWGSRQHQPFSKAMAGTQATLTALPSELIRGIISKILRPKDLLDLALVSKKLHDEVMPCLWEKVMLLPKSRWEIRAKTMDVDEVERLTANDTRERPNIEPIVNHLLNAPQSSRAHIRNLTLYSRYHEVYENSAGALDRLCSGLVGNTLTCLRSDALSFSLLKIRLTLHRIDEPYQLHFDTLRMLLRSQSKLKTLQLGLLDGDMPAQEALLQCASAGDCQGTRGSLEKLIIFVAESDPHSPGARSVSPLGAAFPRLTSLSLLFSSIYTGVFYGNIGNSIFIDNLTKLVLDRLEFNFELYASDSDFWNGFKATNLVSLKIRSCCQPENLLTKLTKLFQTPGFVSKLTKLEFTTTSVEGGHQIPAFNNFLSSFKGLTKLFVFSNEALPWEGVSNHAATLESLNLVVPDPVGIFCQARHIETLFSRCHNLQRLAMPIPDCTTIDFVPASTSEFWGYMVCLAIRSLLQWKHG